MILTLMEYHVTKPLLVAVNFLSCATQNEKWAKYRKKFSLHLHVLITIIWTLVMSKQKVRKWCEEHKVLIIFCLKTFCEDSCVNLSMSNFGSSSQPWDWMKETEWHQNTPEKVNGQTDLYVWFLVQEIQARTPLHAIDRLILSVILQVTFLL